MALHNITFPTEIHEIFADLLAEDGDVNTLTALARTHRSILTRCRSHIFATLDLTPREPHTAEDSLHCWKRVEDLRRILQADPSLSFYVRTIQYGLQEPGDSDGDQDFHLMLQGISQVKTLVLKGRSSRGYKSDVQWPNLPASLRTALESILHSPSLAELYLEHIADFPIKSLTGCQNLSHLTVKSSWFPYRESFSDDDMPITAHRPRSLTIEIGTLWTMEVVQPLLNGQAIVDLRHLTSLTTLDQYNHKALKELLNQSTCLESLTTCTTWIGDSQPFRAALLKAYTLNTLKTFRTTITISSGIGVNPENLDLDPLFDLPDGLVSGSLERTRITVNLPKNAIQPLGNIVPWAKFNIFAMEHRFSALRVFSLEVNAPSEEIWTMHFTYELKRRRGEVFKDLMESDRISFHLAVNRRQSKDYLPLAT